MRDLKINLLVALTALALIAGPATAYAYFSKAFDCEITVSTTVTQIVCPATYNGQTRPPANRQGFTLTVPAGGATIYCGSNDNTSTTTGKAFAASESVTYSAHENAIGCVTASGTVNVDVQEYF